MTEENDKQPESQGTSLDDIMKRNDGLTEVQREAARNFILGGISFLVGLGVTAFTFIWAVDRGAGLYLLMWGPIIFGGERCFQGLRKLRIGR